MTEKNQNKKKEENIDKCYTNGTIKRNKKIIKF